MPEFEESNPGAQESGENLPAFESIRKIALAELGPVLNMSYQEAIAKMQEIASQNEMANPLLVVAYQALINRFLGVQPGNLTEFVLKPDEAQWQELIDTYEDEEEFSIPVAFVVDGDKYNF